VFEDMITAKSSNCSKHSSLDEY